VVDVLRLVGQRVAGREDVEARLAAQVQVVAVLGYEGELAALGIQFDADGGQRVKSAQQYRSLEAFSHCTPKRAIKCPLMVVPIIPNDFTACHVGHGNLFALGDFALDVARSNPKVNYPPF